MLILERRPLKRRAASCLPSVRCCPSLLQSNAVSSSKAHFSLAKPSQSRKPRRSHHQHSKTRQPAPRARAGPPRSAPRGAKRRLDSLGAATMAHQDMRRVYLHIIDDVIAKMKPEFVQEGVDE